MFLFKYYTSYSRKLFSHLKTLEAILTLGTGQDVKRYPVRLDNRKVFCTSGFKDKHFKRFYHFLISINYKYTFNYIYFNCVKQNFDFVISYITCNLTVSNHIVLFLYVLFFIKI